MSVASEYVFETNLEDFDEVVVAASKEKKIVVDFWADWCAPCHALAPHLLRAIETFAGDILLAKVEVDDGENMKLAGRYQLRGFPTVILFEQGEEIARFSGAKSSSWIEAWLTESQN